MTEKSNKTLAIVLTKQEWREDDLRFSFYTQEFGKVEAVAVGARKIKSKLAGHLSSLGIVEILFVKGKAHNKLTHACLMESWPLKCESDLYYTSAILEIIDKSVMEGEYDGFREKIWQLLVWALKNILADAGTDHRSIRPSKQKFILNIFILKLLPILGYEIKIDEVIQPMRDLIAKIQDNPNPQISQADNDKFFLFLKKYLEYNLEKGVLSLKGYL